MTRDIPANPSSAAGDHNLWQATLPPHATKARLEGPLHVEVAVVGAGVTGLSTALHLAESGMQVAIFEAHEVAHRASGRNGGQIVPGVKVNPEALIARFGESVGGRMIRFCYDTGNIVFDLVERHGIAANAKRAGWIQGSFSEASSKQLEKRAQAINHYGGNVKYLDRDAMRAATGSSFWPSGLQELSAGSVQPLAYVRGLAQAAEALGATLYEHSPVDAIRPNAGGAVLNVNGHEVRARHVVLATDAYTDRLWPAVAQSYVNVASAQIATAPLPEDLRARIMPARAGISETRKITYYCRIDPEGRFVIGGRGRSSDHLDPASRKQLQDAAVARFPELADIEWPYGWACRVGMTMDDLPRVHELAPGIWTAYGYCGRGMAIGTALGRVLRDAIQGASKDGLDYPVTPVKRMPMYPARQLGASMTIGWYRLRDAVGFPG